MTLRWDVNPVTLKELRQMVRSRMVAVGLVVYLVAQLAGVGFVLLSSADDGTGVSLYGQALGESVYHMVFFLLSFLLLFCLPLFVGTRMGLERGKEHVDLQFVTSLRPSQFVDGKIASSFVLALVFASAALPFMVLCYLLRGVDLFKILWSFVGVLLVTLGSLYATLFFGALGASRVARLFMLLGVIFSLLFVMGTVNVSSAAVAGSVASSGGSWKAVAGVLCLLALFAWCCALMRVVTVATLSPPHANRALPVRAWFSAFWLFCGAMAAGWSLFEKDCQPLSTWAAFTVLVSILLLAVSASMEPGYSRRVLSAVSRGRGARLVQFFFFSGAESGMAWALALGFCAVVTALLLGPSAAGGAMESAQLTVVFLYLSSFVCSARAIWAHALSRRVPPKFVGAGAFVWLVLACTLPYLLNLEGGAASLERASRWAGNVIAVLGDDVSSCTGFHMACAGAWALISWIACMPAMLGAYRQFCGAGAGARVGGEGR
jgi:hypothetical protein